MTNHNHGHNHEAPHSHGHASAFEDMLSVEQAFDKVIASFQSLEYEENPCWIALDRFWRRISGRHWHFPHSPTRVWTDTPLYKQIL